jgi:type I restriction enzyme S subunit
MVPEGWSTESLKALLTGGVKNGYSPVASEHETGYWVLGLGALGNDGFNPREIKPVEPTAKVKGALLSPGDFLVSRSNTPDKVGRSIMYKGEVPQCSYPDLMMRFRLNSESASHEFIEQKLKSSSIRRYFKNSAAGSSGSMVKINKGILENTPINLPPLPEQKKIAQILSTWDQAINATERLLENSQQRKKGLMQQLLTGKKRLPGFEGEWENSTLTKHCSVGTGNKDLQNKVKDGEYPFFVRSSNIERINSYSFDGKAILIPGDGRVGEIFHYIDGKFDFHQRVYKLSDFKGALGLFIYYYLKRFFKAEVIKNSVKATVDSLRMPVFTGMHIKLPSLEEQQSIVDVLACSDREVQVISQRLELLKQEKKALMQQLLTGKRRVQLKTEAA